MNSKDVKIDITTNRSSISEIRITHLPSALYVTAVGEKHQVKSRKHIDDLMSRLREKVNKGSL